MPNRNSQTRYCGNLKLDVSWSGGEGTTLEESYTLTDAINECFLLIIFEFIFFYYRNIANMLVIILDEKFEDFKMEIAFDPHLRNKID